MSAPRGRLIFNSNSGRPSAHNPEHHVTIHIRDTWNESVGSRMAEHPSFWGHQ